MSASADLLRSLTGGADEEPEHALAGIYLGKVTRATEIEVHFVIEDFSPKLEFGPAPYPKPPHLTAFEDHDHSGSTDPAGAHQHASAGDHDHPGVEMADHQHGPDIPESAGTPDVQSAGAHQHPGVDDHEHGVPSSTHRHELYEETTPPEGTMLAVAFVDGEADRPLVLAFYGWPQ